MAYKDKEKKNKWQRAYRAAHKGLVNQKSRAYRAANIEKLRERDRQSYQAKREAILSRRKEQYSKQVKCRTAVNNAIRDGRLQREICCICEKLYNFLTIGEAHHTDYNKPFDVMWLCGPHHAAHHKWFTPIPPK